MDGWELSPNFSLTFLTHNDVIEEMNHVVAIARACRRKRQAPAMKKRQLLSHSMGLEGVATMYVMR